MSNQMRDTIEQIRRVAPQLNEVTDQADRTVKAVERFLNDECSVGLPCYTLVCTADAGAGKQRETYLGYARAGGKFRIVVEERDVVPSVADFSGSRIISRETTAWSECARHRKLDAVRMLPDLLQAIAAEALNASEKADETVKSIRELRKALGKKKA